MKTERTCTSCGDFKSLEEFARKKDGRDGRACQCKTCAAERQAQYRQTPEGIATEYRYVSSHLDKKLERLRRWRESNPDKVREANRRYQQTLLGRVQHARRQARLKLRKEVDPDKKTRWEHRIKELDQYISRIKPLQSGGTVNDQVYSDQ